MRKQPTKTYYFYNFVFSKLSILYKKKKIRKKKKILKVLN